MKGTRNFPAWLCLPGLLLGTALHAKTWVGELEHYLQNVGDAFTVELNQDAFTTISGDLSARFGGQPHHHPIANQSWTIPLVATIEAEDLSATLKLKNLAITPSNGALQFSATLDQSTLKLGSLRVSTVVLPFLRTTCRDSIINLAAHAPLTIQGSMGLSVNKRGEIKVANPHLDFSLDQQNYQVSGPAACEGVFGIRDYVSQQVLHRLFANARRMLELALTYKVNSFLPTIEGELNRRIALTYPLQLPNLFVLPAVNLGVTLKPRSLVITPTTVRARADVGMVEIATVPLKPQYHGPHGGGTLQAKLGVKAELFNVLFGFLFSRYSREIQLSPQLHQVFGSFLKIEELKTMWPDLALRPQESDLLQLFVSLPQAPRMELTPGKNNQLQIILPQLRLRWQNQRQGSWHDYFLIDTALNLAVDLQVNRGSLKISKITPTFKVQGNWAPDYQPADASFDASLFKELLEFAMEAGCSSLTKEEFVLPRIPLGGRQVAFAGLNLVDPYLKFALVAY